MSSALTPTPLPLPSLDLSPLGWVALTGDFDAVSIYAYENQAHSAASVNDSQALLTQLPNGALATLAAADGDILAVCPFTGEDGTVSRLIVGGSFTSLGGVRSRGIASYDPATNKVEEIDGLTGTVRALLCDKESESVYVGGDFEVGNTSHAAIWSESEGLKTLPFGGFSGPVSSIVKGRDGHIIFGGSFDGVGDVGDVVDGEKTTKKQRKSQIINLSTATITSDAISPLAEFSDPRNAICKNGESEGPGETWLLIDNAPGFWRADMDYTFYPTKLRLYNTHFEGRGTKAFRYQALPDTGIMNLSYVDPESGDRRYCEDSCPLSHDPSKPFQEFEFVNPVGMSGFMLQILDWYGPGAGLNGIELFQDSIFTYAIDEFNEGNCGELAHPSESSRQGDWRTTAVPDQSVHYLTTEVTDPANTFVTFRPDVKESGNYSVLLFTPGCVADGTCASRGRINVTAKLASSTRKAPPVETIIWQTNNFEKYDTIYTGFVEASSESFRPEVTIAPLEGTQTMVADRVMFKLISSTGGLNGLYEYDPKNATKKDLSVNKAGTSLEPNALVSSLVSNGKRVYAAGNFSSKANSRINNILSFEIDDPSPTPLANGGLNEEVESQLVLNDTLYVGGHFTRTSEGGPKGLNHVAAYSGADKSWSALGAGVNGPVTSIVPLSLNISSDAPETVVAVSGSFDEIVAFGSHSAVPVPGFAIWVPSKRNWLNHLDVVQMAFRGQLTAAAKVEDETVLAGSLQSLGIASTGIASLTNSEGLALAPIPIEFLSDSDGGTLAKRETSQGSADVIVAYFDRDDGRNLTILGGQFAAKATNGSTLHNLVFLNGTDGEATTLTGISEGLDANSTVTTLEVQDGVLYAGGRITGSAGGSNVNGVVAYSLTNATFISPQPPALTGSDVFVTAITARPDSEQVYVGGNFSAAGSLPCPSVCVWDTSSNQWSRPGASLTGTVYSMHWASKSQLIVAGDLNVGGNRSRLATYDTSAQSWTSMEGASAATIPGPVTAFGPASQDLSKFWVAGQSSDDGSVFLMNYDGSTFQSHNDLFEDPTTISGLQVIAVTDEHDSADSLNDDQVLVVTGQLRIPDFGNASAAIFNGTVLTPFLLASARDGRPARIHEIFTENQNTFKAQKGHLSTGLVVLISFCISLGCVFLIVALGVILNKIQRHRQGYVRAPTAYQTDRPTSMQRVPPEYLFDSLRQRNSGAPAI